MLLIGDVVLLIGGVVLLIVGGVVDWRCGVIDSGADGRRLPSSWQAVGMRPAGGWQWVRRRRARLADVEVDCCQSNILKIAMCEEHCLAIAFPDLSDGATNV